MIRDASLRFADRLDLTPMTCFASGFFNPFPTGLLVGTPTSVLLQALMDPGQGRPITARFDVTTGFASTDANINVAFAVLVAGSADLVTSPVVLTRTSGLILSASSAPLAANNSYDLVLPKLPTIGSQGRSYIFLGMEIFTTVTFGNPFFTAGAVTAYLALDTDTNVPMTSYPVGWTA